MSFVNSSASLQVSSAAEAVSVLQKQPSQRPRPTQLVRPYALQRTEGAPGGVPKVRPDRASGGGTMGKKA